MQELYIVKNIPDNPKALVLIVHGFAEHLHRYDHIVPLLVQNSLGVYRFDLRGHGQTKTVKGTIESLDEFIQDTDYLVDTMHNEFPNLPIFILGHSMGGMVSAIYGIEHPDKIAGEILSGPALKDLPQVEGKKRFFVDKLSKLLPNLYINNTVGQGLCSDPQVIIDYKNDPLVLKKMSLNLIQEFLVKGSDYIKKNEELYTLPVLILHGENDGVVPENISESFYEHIRSEDKIRKVYPDLRHEILNEKEYEEIVDTINEWINRQLEKIK